MPTINSIGREKVRVSGHDALGKQIKKVFSRARHGVRYLDMARRFQQEMLFDSGLDTNIGTWARLTVRELSDRYRDEHLLKTRAAGNKSYLDLIVRKWGDHSVSAMTIGAVRLWIWELLGGEYSPYTVLKAVRYLVRIFNWGVEVEAIQRNPLDRVIDMALKKEFKRAVKPRRVIIDRDQFDTLISSMAQYLRDIVVMAWATGMRSGEIITVRWGQVRGNRIMFSPAEDKEVHEKEVVLDGEAVAVIDRIRADRLINGIESEYIFLGQNGKRLTNYNVSCAFRHYADKAGFTNMRLHDLRHCYQVRMRRAGHDPKVIAAQLGHRTPDMDAWYDQVQSDELDALAQAEKRRIDPFCQDALAEAIARKLLNLQVPKAGLEPARRFRSKGF